MQMVVDEGSPWPKMMPSVLRALRDYAKSIPPGRGTDEPKRLEFSFGTAHPAYAVLGDALAPRRDRPYAWYVRVADLPGFVRHVAPVLDERLRGSALAGYSGMLHLDFYRGGMRLVFDDGRLTTAEDWKRPLFADEIPGHCGFPPLVFLQLLFGRRSREELEYALPDVWASDEAAMVLDALFPPQPSLILPLD
jgi:hypothetical protein